MAHEMSHVGNYDIRVMTIVVVLVGLIALLADLVCAGRGSAPGRAQQPQQGQGRRRGDHHRRRASSSRSSRRSSRRLIQLADLTAARVPRRRVGRAALPQPGRARARAGEDRRRPRAAGSGEQGDGAPVHQQPAEGAQEQPQQPFSTHPPSRSASACCARCRGEGGNARRPITLATCLDASTYHGCPPPIGSAGARLVSSRVPAAKPSLQKKPAKRLPKAPKPLLTPDDVIQPPPRPLRRARVASPPRRDGELVLTLLSQNTATTTAVGPSLDCCSNIQTGSRWWMRPSMS